MGISVPGQEACDDAIVMPTAIEPAGAGAGAEDLLRSAGLRVTPQRQLILEVLAGAAERHLTAEELWQEVSDRYHSFNRSTVYRVLDQLVAAGVVVQHFLGDTVGRFELSSEAVHHHLVCIRCRSVFDLDPRALRGLIAGALAAHGFCVGTVGVTVEGICRTCASGAASRLSPAAR